MFGCDWWIFKPYSSAISFECHQNMLLVHVKIWLIVEDIIKPFFLVKFCTRCQGSMHLYRKNGHRNGFISNYFKIPPIVQLSIENIWSFGFHTSWRGENKAYSLRHLHTRSHNINVISSSSLGMWQRQLKSESNGFGFATQSTLVQFSQVKNAKFCLNLKVCTRT